MTGAAPPGPDAGLQLTSRTLILKRRKGNQEQS
jgi:hypothetical protein